MTEISEQDRELIEVTRADICCPTSDCWRATENLSDDICYTSLLRKKVAARLEELSREVVDCRQMIANEQAGRTALLGVIKERDARIAELEAALKPFANLVLSSDCYPKLAEGRDGILSVMDHAGIGVSDIKRARAALKEKNDDAA